MAVQPRLCDGADYTSVAIEHSEWGRGQRLTTDSCRRERERFEQTLDTLGGGIGRHGNELAELERELEALITR